MTDGDPRPREADLPFSQSPPSLLSLLYLPFLSLSLFSISSLSLSSVPPPPTGGFPGVFGLGRADRPSLSSPPPLAVAEVAGGGRIGRRRPIPLPSLSTYNPPPKGGFLWLPNRGGQICPPPHLSHLRQGRRWPDRSEEADPLPPSLSTPSLYNPPPAGGFLEAFGRGGPIGPPPRPLRLRRGRRWPEGAGLAGVGRSPLPLSLRSLSLSLG